MTGATMKPAGLAVAWTRRPAKPGRGADTAAPSRHQATHRGAGFVVARHSPAPAGVGLPEREMHLRRSRQVPRRAKRGALQSKVARGCARTPKGPQGAERMEAACEKNGWYVAVAMMPPKTTTLHIEK